MNDKKLVARWQSRSGKHWLELHHGSLCYTYRSSTGGGNLGAITEDAALAYMSEILGKRWLGTLKIVALHRELTSTDSQQPFP